jgi:hypothetical protein
MNIALITSAIAATAGFALAWNLQAHQITKMELTHANERISIQRAARATIERTSNAVIKAQNDAAGRVAVIKRNADSLRVSVDGLRDDLDVTARAAATSIDACTVAARTTSELLAVCADRYSELAGKAEGHVSDIRTLVDAWPK